MQGSIYLSALSLLGITLGSWQKFPFRTYLLEPAFVSSNIDDNLVGFACVPEVHVHSLLDLLCAPNACAELRVQCLVQSCLSTSLGQRSGAGGLPALALLTACCGGGLLRS